MAKYRKKPIVVEAEQWFPGRSVKGVLPFDDPDSRVRGEIMNALVPGADPAHYGILDDPLAGIRVVVAGDWIITLLEYGGYGGRYICKPDVFDTLYEPLDARVRRVH